jgi:hypothetical protein
MAINFKSGPYYDDFDPSKNYYKVLFKPGFAVQARELNQLQSILQHQVSTFANHVFKKNAIIIPGGIVINGVADMLQVTNIGDPTVLIGKTITNAPYFDLTDDSTLNGYITAVVIAVKPETDTTPAVLYLKYFKTQQNSNGTSRSVFDITDNVNGLKTVDQSIVSFKVHQNGATVGKVVTLNKGTFFTKNIFVDAPLQSFILEVDNQTVTNAAIGLDVVESFVSSDDDNSLLDNAYGAPNQYAPGADRYKIDLVLNRYNLTSIPNDEKFILMMRVEDNTVTYLNSTTEYAELMTTMAQRLYDANGNFIVTGLSTKISPTTDDEKLWCTVNPGRAYLGGYHYNQIAKQTVVIEKPRDAAHQEQLNVVNKYADDLTYFFIPGGTYLKQIPEINSLVQFVNIDPSVVGGKVLGYGVFRDIQYAFGDINTGKGIYRAYFDNVTFEKGVSTSSIGGIKTIINGEGFPILHALGISNVINGSGPFTIGDTIQAASDSTQSGYLYHYLNNILYLIKNTENPIPNMDTVKDIANGTTAQRGSTFVTNYDPMKIPLFNINKDTIKTLYTTINGNSINPTSFTITRKQVFSNLAIGVTTSSVLSGNDKYADISPFNYVVVVVNQGSETTYDLTEDGLITLDVIGGSKSYSINLPSGHSLLGKTVWIYSTVIKENESEAKKTVSSLKTITVKTPSDAYTPLEDQDIISVNKITEGRTQSIYLQSNQTNAILFDPDTGKTTVNTVEQHGLSVGDIVVIKGVESSNYPTSYPTVGYNGIFTVTDITSQLAFKISTPLTTVTFDPTTSLNVSTGIFTVNNHGFTTGDQVVYTQGTTSIGGLTNNQVYYAIVLTTNTFQLASTRANAINFIPITITSAGTGTTHKLTDQVPGSYIPGSGFVALPPSITNDTDVTTRYSFTSGQTHSLINTGAIKLKKSAIAPIGQLAVQYNYYNINSSGSYVSVDSYGDHTDDLSYIGNIKDILSPTKTNITLRTYLDFRTRTSSFFFQNIGVMVPGSNVLALTDLNISQHITNLIGKYVVGPSHLQGVQIIGASLNPITGDTELVLDSKALPTGDPKNPKWQGIYYIGLTLQNGTDLTLTSNGTAGDMSFNVPRANYAISYQPTKFKSKQTLIYLNRSNDLIELTQKEVNSIDEANQLHRSPYQLPLTYVAMDPYCVDMSNVRVTPYENPVYTMLDIHEISKKVDRQEYYVSLALNPDLNSDIQQAGSNLDVSAKGFWNENFSDMQSQEFDSPDYSCTIYDKSYVSPGVITTPINLQLDPLTSNNYKLSGSSITLPYTEQIAISQELSTRFNNLNPYNVINWNGKIVLSPAVDNWVDVTTIPAPIATPDPAPPPVYDPPPNTSVPPPVLPEPPVEEIITKITNLIPHWGPDSIGCHHAISFDWETNKGKKGRVSTDPHISWHVRIHGWRGINGDYAKSLINKKYNDHWVKEYLHAGNPLDHGLHGLIQRIKYD